MRRKDVSRRQHLDNLRESPVWGGEGETKTDTEMAGSAITEAPAVNVPQSLGELAGKT